LAALIGMMILLKFISRLPFSFLYAFSDCLFFVTYYVVRYRRALVTRNLSKSFPRKSKQELKLIRKQFYRNLADYAVETIKLLTIAPEDLSARMRFTNVDVIDEYKEKNSSVIILSSHQFNWEWMLVSAGLSLPLPIDFVYQTVSNSFFNDFSLTCRTRFGSYPVRREDVAREVVRRKGIQRTIAILADQYPGLGKDKKYLTTFLNQPTAFFQGANQLAVLTQVPVVFAAVTNVKRGYYEVAFERIAEPPFAKDDFTMIEKYIDAVEKNISENPSGWLWSHDRWKKRHLNS
jgi:Kdo2-lipid IVA lauroyltransferase/acyltransferase